MRRKLLVLSSVIGVLVLGLSACGSSKTTGSAGSPVRGGILNMLGTGDVDYMDPNISYLTTGYLSLRMWSRQLLNYPAVAGQTTDVVADLATQVP
jgi:peptide/nickel transport system substrate-binding protein